MKRDCILENLGKLTIEKSIWSGKYKAYLNNVELKKLDKTVFALPTNEEKQQYVRITGNSFSGIIVSVLGHNYTFSNKVPWYLLILCFIPLAMCLTIGNIPSIAENGFYFVGGALGGFIGGACSGASIIGVGAFQKWYVRLLFALGMIVLAFLVCFGLGNLIVSSIKQAQ